MKIYQLFNKGFKLIKLKYKSVVQRFRFNALADKDKVINMPLGGIKGIGLKFIEDKDLLKKSFPGEIIDEFPTSILNYDGLREKSLKRHGLRQHFKDGLTWEETDLFKIRYKEELKKEKKKGCDNLNDLAKLYQREIDTLYKDIKINGFKNPNNHISIDPIYIHIGSEGELIWTSNGNHRFYIAEILNIDQIPVKVWWRHIDWQLIRENALLLDKNEFYKRYPQFKSHPDLKDLL